MTQRTNWIDYAKGIGIILVVYGHLLSSAYNANLAIPEYFFHLSDSIVYSFHMPLFFFLAGLFVEQSFRTRGVKNFLVSKICYIVYPYFIWSFLQISIELCFSGESHRGVNVYDLLAIPYMPWAQFWFLYALTLMYLSFALLQCIPRFLPVMFAVAAGILFFFPVHTELMALHGFSTEFLFFVFGMFAKHYWVDLSKFHVPEKYILILFLLLTGGGWFVFEHVTGFRRLTDGSHPLWFLLLSVIGIGFCVGLAQYFAGKKGCGVISILGRYSLQIYLVHMLAGVAARIVFLNIFFVQNLVIHLVVGLSAGLFVPILLYKISMRVHFPFLFEFRKESIMSLGASSNHKK